MTSLRVTISLLCLTAAGCGEPAHRERSDRPRHISGALPSTAILEPHGGPTPRYREIDRDPRLDVYGNPVEHAVGEYRVDPYGEPYEAHSPDTEIPKLAPAGA